MFTELDSINKSEDYWGQVIDNNDPLKAGRVRVRVQTIYDEIQDAHIPWAMPKYQQRYEHDVPPLDSIVHVKFLHSDIHYPEWFYQRDEDRFLLSDEDYSASTILLNKKLSDYDINAHVKVQHIASIGLVFEYMYDDKTSTHIIRNDNSHFIQNGSTGQVIHIADDNISLGSENKSAEPATLGDTNVDALNKLNDTIDTLNSILTTNLDILGNIAGANPYTAALKVPITKMSTELKSQINKLKQENSEFFPKTKSTNVTLD